MNFTKPFNKGPVFTKPVASAPLPPVPSPPVDKYQDALNKVNHQYGTSTREADKITLKNLVLSINGLRDEEKDGEITPEEGARSLTALIAKHIGGRRKTRRSKRRKTRRSRK